MKTYSPSASHASSALANEKQLPLRLLVFGAICGVAVLAAVPGMTDRWTQMVDRIDQLCGRASEPFAPLPLETPARQLAGLNHVR